MQPNGEKFEEIYIGTIEQIRPVLLKLEKEQSVHIYPVTRSLSNIAYKVFDLYASHHLLGSIEIREMHKDRVLLTYIAKRFSDRQIQLGTVPHEILPMFDRFVVAFRERLQELGIACQKEIFSGPTQRSDT